MAESVFADSIVQNLLDTDFYKLTMMQAVLHNYPNAEVEWEFPVSYTHLTLPTIYSV